MKRKLYLAAMMAFVMAIPVMGATDRIEDSDPGTVSYDGSLKSYGNADNGKAINLTNDPGQQIVWSYSATSSGTYDLTFRYTRKATMNPSVDITVNGSTQILSLPVTSSNQFTTATLNATLNSGANTIILETNEDNESADIDWIEITAVGGPPQYTVSTTANGSGSVAGGGTYDEGTVISLTATPDTGHQFDGWSGDASGTNNPLTVTVDADKAITGNFSLIPVTYNLTTTVVGSGSVSPASGTFDEGTVVSLTATPDAGFSFSGWSGDATGSTNPLSVTMDSDKNITATFTSTGGGGDEVHNFTESGTSSSFYSISGNLSTTKGTVIYQGLTLTQCLKIESSTLITFTTTQAGDLTLVFNDGYNGGINVDGTSHSASSGILVLTLQAGSHNITKDNVANLFYMSLSYGNPPTQYTVTTSTNGNGAVSGGGTYNEGTVISLVATPDSGYQFDNWTGDATGSSNPLSVTVDANKSITANFSVATPGQFSLSTTIVGSGSVSPASGTFSEGTVVSITASPASGWSFVGWSGDASGNTNPLSLTMDSNKSITATFSDGSEPPVNYDIVGWATEAGGTTGGAGGISITCATGDCIQTAINDKRDGVITQPLIIFVDGIISPSNTTDNKINVKDARDISIVGVGMNGEFNGIGIKLWRAGNVIIQNVTVHHVDIGDKDAISIEGPSDHIWVDHCELYAQYQGVNKDYYDGLLDAKSNAEYITYSWNYMHDSWKMMLVGSSDSDNDDRKITIHHNYFDNVNSRMPLFRFGQGHIYNNYYSGVESTGINSRMGACLKVENNYFQDSHNPVVSAYSSQLGAVDESGSIYDNVTWDLSGSDVNEPLTCTANIPYSYSATLNNTSNVPSLVVANVGVGHVGGSGSRTAPEKLHDSKDLFDLKVYPNPVQRTVTIEIPDFSGNETIRIVNLMGVEMMKFKPKGANETLDISEFSSGGYVIQVNNGRFTRLKMFIKN